MTVPQAGPGVRQSDQDLEAVVRDLGEPRQTHDGRLYLAGADGHRIELPRKTARNFVAQQIRFAVKKKFGACTATAAAVNRVAADVVTACQMAPPDPPDDTPRSVDRPTWSDRLEAFPEGWRVPEGWTVSSAGIWREGGLDKPDLRVTYGPVLVVRTYTDPDHQQMADVAWQTESGAWRLRTVPRLVTRSGTRTLKALGDEGFPAIEQDSKHVERWLAESEKYNRRCIPDEPIARWLGWQSPTSFLASADGVRYMVREPRQELPVHAHRAAGTMAGWLHSMRLAEAWPVTHIVVSAGLSAILLRHLGLPSTILDIFGRSSRGKSLSAAAAFSAFGNPDKAAGGIAKWADTIYMLEVRLAVCRGIPIVVDESQNVGRKGAQAVVDFVYGVENDRSTVRGHSDLMSSASWSTVLISTGEKSLTKFGDAQGLAPRRIPIGVPPIPPALTPDELERIRAFELGLKAHYGHAGPAFAARLIAELERAGADWLRQRHADLATRCGGPSDFSKRRAGHVAAIRLAAELGHEWGILPFPPPPWQVWEDVLLSEEATEGEDQADRGANVVATALAARPSWIYDNRAENRNASSQPVGGEWIARVKVIDVDGVQRRAVLVPVENARKWLTAAGMDYEACRNSWVDGRKIVSREEARGDARIVRRWTHKARIAGSSAIDCLAFHPDVIEPPRSAEVEQLETGDAQA